MLEGVVMGAFFVGGVVRERGGTRRWPWISRGAKR